MSHANRYIRVYSRLYLYMQARCRPWPSYPPCRVFACVLTLVKHSQIRALSFNLVSHTLQYVVRNSGLFRPRAERLRYVKFYATRCRPCLLHLPCRVLPLLLTLVGRSQIRALHSSFESLMEHAVRNGGCWSHVLSVCCM